MFDLNLVRTSIKEYIKYNEGDTSKMEKLASKQIKLKKIKSLNKIKLGRIYISIKIYTPILKYLPNKIPLY